MENLGGRLISLYYSFGGYDGVILMEAPDEQTAAAIVLAAVSPGNLQTIRTTTPLSVEYTTEALRKAGEITYRGPKQ